MCDYMMRLTNNCYFKSCCDIICISVLLNRTFNQQRYQSHYPLILDIFKSISYFFKHIPVNYFVFTFFSEMKYILLNLGISFLFSVGSGIFPFKR